MLGAKKVATLLPTTSCLSLVLIFMMVLLQLMLQNIDELLVLLNIYLSSSLISHLQLTNYLNSCINHQKLIRVPSNMYFNISRKLFIMAYSLGIVLLHLFMPTLILIGWMMQMIAHPLRPTLCTLKIILSLNIYGSNDLSLNHLLRLSIELLLLQSQNQLGFGPFYMKWVSLFLLF